MMLFLQAPMNVSLGVSNDRWNYTDAGLTFSYREIVQIASLSPPLGPVSGGETCRSLRRLLAFMIPFLLFISLWILSLPLRICFSLSLSGFHSLASTPVHSVWRVFSLTCVLLFFCFCFVSLSFAVTIYIVLSFEWRCLFHLDFPHIR